MLNLNYTVTYLSFESLSRLYVFAHHRRYNVPGILFIVNLYLKEDGNIARRCKTMMSYQTHKQEILEIKPQINRTLTVEAKLTKEGKLLGILAWYMHFDQK